MKILFCLLLLTLVGCLKTPTPNELLFSSKETREAERLRNMENLRILEAQELRIFEQEKKQSWETIVEDANQSYKSIEHLINKKCSACHDSRVRLPFYGRIFPRINPITAHQVDGLRDLDFGKKFPLNAVGKVDQIALLTAIKN